jgi:hypothetical protein
MPAATSPSSTSPAPSSGSSKLVNGTEIEPEPTYGDYRADQTR